MIVEMYTSQTVFFLYSNNHELLRSDVGLQRAATFCPFSLFINTKKLLFVIQALEVWLYALNEHSYQYLWLKLQKYLLHWVFHARELDLNNSFCTPCCLSINYEVSHWMIVQWSGIYHSLSCQIPIYIGDSLSYYYVT